MAPHLQGPGCAHETATEDGPRGIDLVPPERQSLRLWPRRQAVAVQRRRGASEVHGRGDARHPLGRRPVEAVCGPEALERPQRT